ncbi:helix-turn-helix domain-containing protein [Pelobacter propionicus]|uniref:helix-turn-helix domain-containing protein n=1 Tax=Pelobacter propionicus TaxID=29543 RepID=UPI0012EE7E4D|nr:helix-turn-helix domain-containing protein [Pelobacter propionicus]
MLTFLYNSYTKRHSFSIKITTEKQQLPGYPTNPITIGDHIRKRRMDLGLLQREVAEIVGVTESSVWNWEHGTEPELQYNPKIINFLGYAPFDCPDDTVGRLAWYKRAMGMNLDRLGEVMGCDPEQLSDWLSGRHKPFRKSLEKIERFLGREIGGTEWLSCSIKLIVQNY